MRGVIALVLSLCCMNVAVVHAANSLVVTSTASMGSSTASANCTGDSQPGPCGLELRLDDPTNVTSTQAYVQLGPDKGLSDETALRGSFFINPQSLVMDDSQTTTNHFQLMLFYKDFVDPVSSIPLIFFLHKDADTKNWFITVWNYNETANNFVFTCNGFFALPNSTAFNEVFIEFDWSAGNPGRLQMWRTTYSNGTATSARTQMFDTPVVGQQNAAVNHVFTGMFNPGSHQPGTVGTVGLDEFTFARFTPSGSAPGSCTQF